MEPTPTGTDELTPVSEQTARFARFFDHTNLKPESGAHEIEQLAKEAAASGFAAVCVAPRWVAYSAELLLTLKENRCAVCAVVGFPHGNSTTETKVFEARDAIRRGATEVDMVISIGDLKNRNRDMVRNDIRAVVEEAHSQKAISKVILETGYLERDEVILGCELTVQAGADFVKTSTGFGPSGADVDTVQLMRKTVGKDIGVKAAGGIRTLADAVRMIDAGASRLGCSSSVQIMEEYKKSSLG